MDYNIKYLKYKKKYLVQKGGLIQKGGIGSEGDIVYVSGKSILITDNIKHYEYTSGKIISKILTGIYPLQKIDRKKPNTYVIQLADGKITILSIGPFIKGEYEIDIGNDIEIDTVSDKKGYLLYTLEDLNSKKGTIIRVHKNENLGNSYIGDSYNVKFVDDKIAYGLLLEQLSFEYKVGDLVTINGSIRLRNSIESHDFKSQKAFIIDLLPSNPAGDIYLVRLIGGQFNDRVSLEVSRQKIRNLIC